MNLIHFARTMFTATMFSRRWITMQNQSSLICSAFEGSISRTSGPENWPRGAQGRSTHNLDGDLTTISPTNRFRKPLILQKTQHLIFRKKQTPLSLLL